MTVSRGQKDPKSEAMSTILRCVPQSQIEILYIFLLLNWNFDTSNFQIHNIYEPCHSIKFLYTRYKYS